MGTFSKQLQGPNGKPLMDFTLMSLLPAKVKVKVKMSQCLIN
jgi:hypothetical protein